MQLFAFSLKKVYLGLAQSGFMSTSVPHRGFSSLYPHNLAPLRPSQRAGFLFGVLMLLYRKILWRLRCPKLDQSTTHIRLKVWRKPRPLPRSLARRCHTRRRRRRSNVDGAAFALQRRAWLFCVWQPRDAEREPVHTVHTERAGIRAEDVSCIPRDGLSMRPVGRRSVDG